MNNANFTSMVNNFDLVKNNIRIFRMEKAMVSALFGERLVG